MRRVASTSFCFLASASLLLGGCAIIPTSGPNITAAREHEASLPFVIVPLTAPLAEYLASVQTDATLGSLVRSKRAHREQTLGPGDVVSITIFEAASGGLFIPSEAGSRSGNFVTIPDQQVGLNGSLEIPYVPKPVKVSGRTVESVQNEIERELKNRAIDPQVVVSLKEQRSTTTSVFGEVNAPAQLALSASGDRVLDAIARAGGPKDRGFDTFVTLQRPSIGAATVSFDSLVSDRRNNIEVLPGDTIYVFTQPRSFLAFGAAGQNGKFDFQANKLNLAEAIARAGGLNDERANPAAVYVYRTEPREVAAKIGVDLTAWPDRAAIPIIYNLNLRDKAGYFVGRSFNMHDKDLVYVSNAPGVEIAKILSLTLLAAETANQIIGRDSSSTSVTTSTGASGGATP